MSHRIKDLAWAPVLHCLPQANRSVWALTTPVQQCSALGQAEAAEHLVLCYIFIYKAPITVLINTL